MNDKTLFSDIIYFGIGSLNPEIEKLLRNGGAQNKKFMVETVTHLICALNYTEEELVMNLDLYNVKAVSEIWVLHSVKLNRLAETKAFDPSRPRLLRNIRATVINLSIKDLYSLYAILTYHGAQVTSIFGSSNTHLICGMAKGSTYTHVTSQTVRSNISIVSPDWVIDSIKVNQLLPVEIYHPRLLLNSVINEQILIPSTTVQKLYHIERTSPNISSTSHEMDRCSLSSILGLDDAPGTMECKINRSESFKSEIHDPNAAQTIANIKSQLQASLPPNKNVMASSLSSTKFKIATKKNELDTVMDSAPNTPQTPQQQIFFVRPRNFQQNAQSQQIILQHKIIPTNANSLASSNNQQKESIALLQQTQSMQQQQQHTRSLSSPSSQYQQQQVQQPSSPSNAKSSNVIVQEGRNTSTIINSSASYQSTVRLTHTPKQLQNGRQTTRTPTSQYHHVPLSPTAMVIKTVPDLLQNQQNIVLTPHIMQQHVLRQQHVVHQQQIQLQQQLQSCTNLSSQQQAVQRHLHQQQQQLIQQQQQLQQQINQSQKSPRLQNSQSPVVVVSQAVSPSTINQQGNMQSPSCQQSPPSQMTPPLSSSPQQQLGRQNRPEVSNQQQSTMISQPPFQQPFQQQQRLQLHQQHSPQLNSKSQSSSPQQSLTSQTITDKQQAVSIQNPIDPTDPVQVAQVLSRSTMSPNHESLIMRQQHLKQQQATMQQIHSSSLQSPLQQQLQQTSSISAKSQQQMIINQGNQQVITQRHVINTSTSQGQQIIQNHMMIAQNQSPHQQQVVQQKLSSMAITTPTISVAQQQSNLTLGGGQLRIIQQSIQQPQSQQQSPMIKNQTQQPLGNDISFQLPAQQQSNVQSIQLQQQLIQQLPNKPRFIISQQQFNQLSVQQQQQILQQNQQNQNIFIVNQTNVNPPQSQVTMSNLAQHQAVTNNLNPRVLSHQQTTQKYSQIQNHTESSILASPTQSPQQTATQSQIILSSQHQQRLQLQTQPVNIPVSQQHQQQIVINQQVINSSQRLQFVPQQPQKHQSSVKLVSQTQLQQAQTSQHQPIVIQQTITQPPTQNVANNNNSNESITLQQGQIIVQQKQPSLFLQQQSNNSESQPQQITIINNQQQSQNSLKQTQPNSIQQHSQNSPNQSEQLTNWQSTQQQIAVSSQQIPGGGIPQQTAIQMPQNVTLQQKPQSHLKQTSSQLLREGNSVANQWQPGQQSISPVIGQSSGQPQRQLIQLDDKTHAHFMSLDPIKKAEYIAKLHQSKQRVMLRPQISYQSRPSAPNVVASSLGTAPRPVGQGTQHIIVQSQMPTGLTQQQQMQWLQQQGTRQFVVRSGATPTLSPIQQQSTSQQPQQFVNNDLNQQIFQKQQLRVQQIQLQQQTITASQKQSATTSVQLISSPGGQITEKHNVMQQTPTLVINKNGSGSNSIAVAINSTEGISQGQQHQPIVPTQSPQQMNLKTKTALANMLSNRLGNNGNSNIQQTQSPQPQLIGNSGDQPLVIHSPVIQQTQIVLSAHSTSLQSSQQFKTTVQNKIHLKANSIQTNIAEPSAAGTLRLMTQQHNAALKQTSGNVSCTSLSNNSVSPTGRTQQELLLIQQQELKRKSSQDSQYSNASVNASGQQQTVLNSSNDVLFQQHQQQQSPIVSGMQQQMSVMPSGMQLIPTGSYIQNRSINMQLPVRPQYYGHNPNLKLPQELFLVGCTFYVVEYQETDTSELPLWLDTVRQYGGEIDKIYGPRVTHVLCRTQRHGVVMQALRDSKRCITVYWLNDICAKRQLLPPWQPLHLPFPSTFGYQKPLEKYLITADGFEVHEYQRLRQMVEECGGIYTSYLSKFNTLLISKKLEGEKLKVGKDWNIPVVNVLWLNDICVGNLSQITQFDCQKYQQYNLSSIFRIDYPLVPHLLAAWKAPINLTQEAHERVKRSLSDTFVEPTAKRNRPTYVSEEVPDNVFCIEYPFKADKKPKVIFSQVVNIDVLKKITQILGGIVVNDPAEATHLVMTRENRTCKLIQAICYVTHIVKSSWLLESGKQGKFLPVENFCINNIPLDENLNIDLASVVSSTTRSTLFAGITFYVTPDVFPAYFEIVRMIEASGGKIEEKRKSAFAIAEAIMQNPESYIIVTCPNDMFMCVDLTRYGICKCPIVSTEFVMSSILKQKLEIAPNLIPYMYNHNNLITNN